MANQQGSSPTPNSLPSDAHILTTSLRYLPSPAIQATYFATGSLAGLTALPIDAAFARATTRTPPPTFLRAALPATLARAGIRFWAFALTKHNLAGAPHSAALPAWLKGGLAGGAGGLAEALLHGAAAARRVPPARAVLGQGARTFVGFSTFTFLWGRWRGRADGGTEAARPPAPFARCWAFGVVAGGVASAVVGVAEGSWEWGFWSVGVPRGALVVGTTIGVQVWTAGWALRTFGWEM